jgi:hypothetical protein
MLYDKNRLDHNYATPQFWPFVLCQTPIPRLLHLQLQRWHFEHFEVGREFLHL